MYRFEIRIRHIPDHYPPNLPVDKRCLISLCKKLIAIVCVSACRQLIQSDRIESGMAIAICRAAQTDIKMIRICLMLNVLML